MNARKWFESLEEKFRDDPEFIAEKLALNVAAQIDLTMQRKGITRSELAKRIGTSTPYVSQVLNGTTNMTILTVCKLASAVGLEVDVQLRDAAAHSEEVDFEDVFTELIAAVRAGRPTAPALDQYQELPGDQPSLAAAA